MLDKIKGLSTQVVTKAGDAVDGITTSVKGGVESLANSASNMTVALNEKAVRVSTAQVCEILELAIDELKGRPLARERMTLTASVNIGIAALEMHVHLDPSDARSAGAVVDQATQEQPSAASDTGAPNPPAIST